tara:strand:- start:400 stop:945 length:546 start_codon:yes stop_codon:yes gene_type:complete
MPVTINGNGSITGLSVGGLGSGVVNEATIANGAVTQAKRTFATGEVLQVVHNHFSYSGGAHSGLRAETSWTDVVGLTLSITPIATNSTIILSANCRLGSSYGSYITQYFKWVDSSGNDLTPYNNNYVYTTDTGTGNIHLPIIASQTGVSSAQTYKLRHKMAGGNGLYIYSPVICSATEIKG